MKKAIILSIAVFALDCLFVVITYGLRVVEISFYYFEIKYLWIYLLIDEHVMSVNNRSGFMPEPTIAGYILISLGVSFGLYLNYRIAMFFMKKGSIK